MIITQEHLLKPALKIIFADLHSQWKTEQKKGFLRKMSFDEWIFVFHFNQLGEALYNFVGDYFGDLDEMTIEWE